MQWKLRVDLGFRSTAIHALRQNVCGGTTLASRETTPPSTPLDYIRVRGGCWKGEVARTATRDPGGPPPPCFESVMAAHTHDSILTLLDYTGRKGEQLLPWSFAGYKELRRESGPGEEPWSPAINPRPGGFSILC
jgi:hypothetical protein